MSTETKQLLSSLEKNLRTELQNSIDTIDKLTAKHQPELSEAISANLISGMVLGKLASVIANTIAELPETKESKGK